MSPRMNVGGMFNGTLRFPQGHEATVRVDEAHSPLERRNERRELENKTWLRNLKAAVNGAASTFDNLGKRRGEG